MHEPSLPHALLASLSRTRPSPRARLTTGNPDTIKTSDR